MASAKETIDRIFLYQSWANRRVADSIGALGEENPKRENCLKLFGHILGASSVWRARILGEGTEGGDVWPTYSLEECTAQADSEAEAWERYLAPLTEKELSSTIRYTNLSGTPFENSLGDILEHVVNHGSHHRGQIAMLVREGGAKPAVTDFIVFARDRHITHQHK